MKTTKNKLISSKLIYILGAGIIAIIVALMIKTYPKMKLPERMGDNIKTEDAQKINIAILQRKGEVTARGTTDVRATYVDINNQDNKEEKSNNNQENKKEKKDTTKYISINQVKISRGMDLTKRTGLSRKDFIKLISNVKQDTSGFFKNNAGTIYDLCKKYNINEIFFCGLISAESGWNIASNHRTTHNYISLMKNGKLIKYSSVENGLEVAAQKLHYNYLTPGGKFYCGKTLSAVKTRFCPASSTWVNLVYGRMQQIV